MSENGAGQATLVAARQRASGHLYFPVPPADLPIAGVYDPVALSPEAVLYSFTILHPGPKSGQPPVALAYADFPERVRVLGRLRLPGDGRPAIGARLRVEVAPAPVSGAAPAYFFVPIP